MISEGSCDTEDWSNDAENSALITEINYILKYIQIESSYFKLKSVQFKKYILKSVFCTHGARAHTLG